MARIRYSNQKLGPAKRALIAQADEICQGYRDQGLVLTLRQVYYQFVARGLLDNNQANYDRLGDALSDGRMTGLLDWDFLIDRTRNLIGYSTWGKSQEIVADAAASFAVDLWAPQHEHVEVWIEKDAAIGVVEQVCARNQVPYFSCRGYTSVSELWNAAQRLGAALQKGDRVTILHIGDHDPSGLDMTRDIRERLATFIHNDWVRRTGAVSRTGHGIHDHMRRHMRNVPEAAGGGKDLPPSNAPWRVRRIALNMDQVRRYQPPPNYAKISDSRHRAYVEATGVTDSWELDALEPSVLDELIQVEVSRLRDPAVWEQTLAFQESQRGDLQLVASAWPQAVEAARVARPPTSNPF